MTAAGQVERTESSSAQSKCSRHDSPSGSAVLLVLSPLSSPSRLTSTSPRSHTHHPHHRCCSYRAFPLSEYEYAHRLSALLSGCTSPSPPPPPPLSPPPLHRCRPPSS